MNGEEADIKRIVVALVAGLALTGTCLAAPHGGPRGWGRGPAPMHHGGGGYHHHGGGYHHHHGGHHGGWIIAGAAAIGGLFGAILCGR